MLNCKEACKLLSQGQDRELTRGERWQLRLHRLAFAKTLSLGFRHSRFHRRLARSAITTKRRFST